MEISNKVLLNDRYRLDEEVGHGGMGVVYRGWDTLLQRDVAVKILSPDSLGGGGTARLLNEARIIARLDHPNIVTVYDAGQVEGTAFIVMQYMNGGTLADLQSVDLDEIYSIAIQICSALSHAHVNGVVHRDLKPENIFLIPIDSIETGNELLNARVKIVDFGIAHSDLANLTIQGEISGTVAYMAPEQALGQQTTPQTDLYALGVMLFELAAGQLPFKADNPMSMISQHINADVIPPSQVNPEVPPELDTLVMQLMSKDPDNRPGSAKEVEDLLLGFNRSDGESDSFRSLQSGVHHNLPLQLTSFIGRKQEIDEISQLIGQDSCRLLTLVGPGGIGKTRLAIEAAAHNLSNFRDGIYYVSLGKISSPDFILSAIAEALDFSMQTHGSVDPQNQLIDYLAKINTLLVLDNYEHLIDGTGILIDLLKRAPTVKLMITSRERLNLQGEWIFKVPGLTYPKNGSPDSDLDSSALDLFIERAKLADSKFSFTDDERQHLVKICQLVEGIPLGIELASVWVSMLSPEEIAKEIEKNLDFLTSSMQDLPDKHRSIRAAFDYSWALLPEEQRQVFVKLSVFRGGFNRQAAMEIADAGLMDLSTLVDKSFIRRDDGDRYAIHELLRQYGEQKLQEDGDKYDEIASQHGKYYLEFLHNREEAIIGEKKLIVKDEILLDIENIRSALQWGIIAGKEEEIRAAFAVLHCYYFIQGYFEGVETFKNIASFIENHYQTGFDATAPGSLMYLSARTFQAFYLSMSGTIKSSDDLLSKTLPGLREMDLPLELLVCLMGLGINCSYKGEYENAEVYLNESLQIGEQIQDNFNIVAGKIWLGWVYYERGETDLALKEWQEGQSISLDINDRLMLAFIQSKLALLGEETGDYENAIKIQLEARENFKHFGDQVGIGYATSRMALSLIGIGEYQEAKRIGYEAYQNFEKMNHRWGVPASLCRIGYAEIELGEYQDAWAHFCEALTLSQKGQMTTLTLYSLIGIGKLLVREGQVEHGVEILSFVIANPITPSIYRDTAENELSRLEGEHSAGMLRTAGERGKTSELQAIIDSLPETLEVNQVP